MGVSEKSKPLLFYTNIRLDTPLNMYHLDGYISSVKTYMGLYSS